MSRLSLPHNSPLETFLSALRGRINQTRLDLAPLVDSERLDAINDRSAAEQAEFHAILLQLVPTQWLPPRPPPKARALFSQICMSVRRSALAPTTSAPTSTVTAPSSLGNSAQNLPPPRMTMAEARAQLSRQEQPMNESSSPLVSPSKREASASDVGPSVRRRVDQEGTPLASAATPLDTIASSSSSAPTGTIWRPELSIITPKMQCYSCGSDGHSTKFCLSLTLAVTSTTKPSIVRGGAGQVHMLNRDVDVCKSWMYRVCKKRGLSCEYAHLCPLCDSPLHHPTRCYLLEYNLRRPILAPIARPPRPDFVLPSGPIYVIDSTLGKGFKDSWEWSPSWKPFPECQDVYGALRPSETTRHRAMIYDVKNDGPLGSFTVDASTLRSEAAAFLSVPGHISRIVPGEETRTGEDTWAEDSDEIRNILDDRIYPMYTLPNDTDVAPELARERDAHEELVRQVQEAEFECVRRSVFTQAHLDALKSAAPKGRRFQKPDGVPNIARLVIVGNYPVPHSDTRGLTPLAFSTRLIASLGITSPSITGNFSAAFINRVGAFYPPSNQGGIHYPRAGSAASVKMPKVVEDVWNKNLLGRYANLFKLPGSRVVVTYGSENRKLVQKATAQVDGSRVFKWTCRSPAVGFSETASSVSKNAGVRALLEGVQEPTLESYGQVEWDVWKAMRGLTEDLENELGNKKKNRWAVGTAPEIPMFLVHSKTSTTFFLTLDHPQSVDTGYGSHHKAAAVNLGTTFASDFMRGSLFSRKFDSPEWPFLDAFCQKADRALADKQLWHRGKRYEADHGVLKRLSTMQESILRGQARERFFFGLHHLPTRFQDYLEGIQFVPAGTAGATKLEVAYSDVVGIMKWVVKNRGGMRWNGVGDDDDVVMG